MIDSNSEAIKEILKSINYLVNQAMLKTTKCYNGIVKSQEGNKWTVQFNGEAHLIPHYGENSVVVGKVVKVFIPENNISLAFFI